MDFDKYIVVYLRSQPKYGLITPKFFLMPLKSISPSIPTSGKHSLPFPIVLSFPECHINGIIQYEDIDLASFT